MRFRKRSEDKKKGKKETKKKNERYKDYSKNKRSRD